MNLYSSMFKTNQNHKHRQAISITMASGEVRKYTYEALFNGADVYAQKMINAGIVKGDRIVIASENSPQWQIAFLAIMQVKGTAVIIDESLPEDVLKASIEQADARCIFASIKVKEKLGKGTDYRVPMFNLSKDGEVFKDSFSVLSPFVERTQDPMPEIAIIFMDGSTNREIKGAMYTHNAMLKQVKNIISVHDLSRNEHILSIIPNSRIEGMVSGVLTTMLVGAAIHYVESLDYESLSRALKWFKPTIFLATSAILQQLKEQMELTLKEDEGYKAQLEKCEKLRKKTNVKLANMTLKQLVMIFGGRLEMIWSYQSVKEEVMRFYYALGVDVLLHYGCLETNTPILGNQSGDVTRNTCGKPYPGMEIELRQPNAKQQGEMYVKSPYGMVGYFRNSKSYEKYFVDGWFNTGDLAEVTANGHVRVLYKETDQIENQLKDLGGLSNKTNSAYYWFNTWRKAIQCLYKITITNENSVPERRGCIIYSPFETNKGYLGLTIGYSKERFFKFGYLTNVKTTEKVTIEEAFGKIYYTGETIDEETKQICLKQLAKGWAIIVKAPKDVLNADFTEQIVQLAKTASVPIVPAYVEGEEDIFSEKKNMSKLFDLQSKKRYSLDVRYGKPIKVDEENGKIKRKIQEQFTNLIENHPQEESEIDETTRMALEKISLGKQLSKKAQPITIDQSNEEGALLASKDLKKEEVLENLTIDFETDELEEHITCVDLSTLLASDEKSDV